MVSEALDALDAGDARLYLRVIDQAEAALKDAHARLVRRDVEVRAFLAGAPTQGALAVASRLTAALEEHSAARRFFVDPPARSHFVPFCALLGQDPDQKREALRPWLWLPWSGHLLRKALAAHAPRRRGRRPRGV